MDEAFRWTILGLLAVLAFCVLVAFTNKPDQPDVVKYTTKVDVCQFAGQTFITQIPVK